MLVALFKHRVNANDVSTDASTDDPTDVSTDVSTNISLEKVALLPLHFMAVLVDTLEWDPRLLSGLGGRRHMLTMLLEHSNLGFLRTRLGFKHARAGPLGVHMRHSP